MKYILLFAVVSLFVEALLLMFGYNVVSFMIYSLFLIYLYAIVDVIKNFRLYLKNVIDWLNS